MPGVVLILAWNIYHSSLEVSHVMYIEGARRELRSTIFSNFCGFRIFCIKHSRTWLRFLAMGEKLVPKWAKITYLAKSNKSHIVGIDFFLLIPTVIFLSEVGNWSNFDTCRQRRHPIKSSESQFTVQVEFSANFRIFILFWSWPTAISPWTASLWAFPSNIPW